MIDLNNYKELINTYNPDAVFKCIENETIKYVATVKINNETYRNIHFVIPLKESSNDIFRRVMESKTLINWIDYDNN
jgi:hypothetical protein